MKPVFLLFLLNATLLATVGCGRTSSSLETLPLSPAQLNYVRRYQSPVNPNQVQKVLDTLETIQARIERLDKKKVSAQIDQVPMDEPNPEGQ